MKRLTLLVPFVLLRPVIRIALQRYWECEPRSILVRRDLSALAIFFLVYPALSNSVRGEQSAHEVSVYSEEQALRGAVCMLNTAHLAMISAGSVETFCSKITLPASSTTHTDVAFIDRLHQHETPTVMRLTALTGGSRSDAEKENTGRTRGSDCRRPATNTTRDNAVTLQLSRRQGAKLLARGAVALAAPFSYFSILGTKEVLAEEFAADRKTIEQWMDQWMIVTKQVSGSLHVQRFADPIYILTKPITWKPNPGQERLAAVTVPVGFVTDFASIPRLFWSALRPDGNYTFPAIVHDYLYWTQLTSREDADDILKFGMQDMNIGTATVTAIYSAVLLFGEIAWNSNAKQKVAGEKRILRRFPDLPTTTWDEWKQDKENFR